MSSSTDFTVRILGDATNAKKVVDQFGDDIKTSSSGWGGMFKNAASVAGGALAAIGIDQLAGQVVDFGQQSVGAFKEAEEAQASLERAYQQFPGIADVNISKLRELNAAIQAKTGFDDDQLAASQATLAQFGLTGAQIEQLTPLMVDYAAKTGTDLATAAESMGKAVLGQGKALKTVGVDFADTGTAAGNFDQIIAGLDGKVGGFAETMGTTGAGKARILESTFGELQETIGSHLLPVITSVQSFLITDLIPAFSSTVEWVTKNKDLVLALSIGVAAGAVAFGTYTAALALHRSYTAASALATGGLTVAQWAFNAAASANPIGLIIIAIAALVAAIIFLVMNWDSVVAWITEIWGGFIGWITGVIDGFVGWWNGIWSAVGTFIGDVWRNFTLGIQLVWDGWIAWITGVVLGFVGWWNGIWSAVGTFIGDVWRNFTTGIQILWNGFWSWISGAISGLGTWIKTTWEGIWSGLGTIVKNVWNGILGWIEGGVNGAIDLINGMIGAVNNVGGVVGINIGLIPKVRIPRLAEGTVTNGPMFAMVGDNPGGREVIRSVDSYDRELRRAYDTGRQSTSQANQSGPMRLSREDLDYLADRVGGIIHTGIAKGAQRQVRAALGG